VRDHNGQALGQIITASITNESADELKLESHEAILRASATPIVARQIQKGLSRASRLRPMARGC
jgi:hypothetical protein